MKNLSNDVTIHKKSGELEYLQFRRLLEYEDVLVHAFTTKHSGVSGKNNNMLNFFLAVDKKENVLKNYEIICNELDMNVANIVCTLQTHGNTIEVLTKDNVGAGISKKHISDSYDGLVTNERNVITRTMCADCTLILFFDPIKKILCNIHAGWRGVVGDIITNAVSMMVEKYKCDPKDIIACCGPSIKKCCFEFSKVDMHYFDKYKNVVDAIMEHENEEKCYIDLDKIIEYQLRENGIIDKNIEISNICTKCNSDIFFSARGDKGIIGEQVLLAGLKSVDRL